MTESEQPYAESIKLATFGDYGTGKTFQAGTLIERYGPENVLLVSCERGLRTIQSKLRADRVHEANSYQGFREAWKRASEEAKKRVEAKLPKLWVVLDGMSRVMDWRANEHLALADKYAEAVANGTTHEQIDSALKPYRRFMSDKKEGVVNTIAVYQLIGRDAEQLLSQWVALPINIYATYLADLTSQDMKKTFPWVVDVPGNVGYRAVMSTFDFVGFCGFKSDGKFYVGFDPRSNLYRAKIRIDKSVANIPPEIVDFNLAEFVEQYLTAKEKSK